MLRQPQYHPKTQHEQVITLVMALAHTMVGLDVDDITSFIEDLITMFETEHSDLCSRIDSTGVLDDDLRKEITDISAAFREKWTEK
jgi:F-type H+-transporting ATPase subunit alpha